MRQTLLFSATMLPEIKALAKKFMKFPVEVRVDPAMSTADTVEQFIVKTNERGKREVLRNLIRAENVQNAMIFCNRKKDVDILFKSFTKHQFSVAALHGDMAQGARTETLNAFRDGKVQLLVCSDVARAGWTCRTCRTYLILTFPSIPKITFTGSDARGARENRPGIYADNVRGF